AHIEDISQWNWDIGEELSKIGKPLRSIADPTRYGHPAHMRNFKRVPPGEPLREGNDWGYVHSNSGIHNKAAHNLFVSGVFTWREVLSMFYLTLTKPGLLTATSDFADSKAGMLSVCESLFGTYSDLTQRMETIANAFAGVGI
ncbi:MAG: M4 family metallopeptidase, partial [Deltaproteobacteria bacterium]|nr:M4 family metallopeptidase [Deltaproteobacteria bacterium]